MTCRDVRNLADSFLSDELLTETNHEILRHLEVCASCRDEIEARRRLREALRAAFERSPDLQSRPGFADGLREQLRQTPARAHGSWILSRRWLALAAGVLIVAGLVGIFLPNPPLAPADALARDAVGDHRNCALKFRLVRKPIPLEEAAQRFDAAYRLLLTAPPDHIATPGGAVRVLERHSCAYGERRFGHVVMQYGGRVVSLLITADDGAAGGPQSDPTPHLLGRPGEELSVVSVSGTRHAVLLVSDLDSLALTQLSKTVSVPLAQRLQGSLRGDPGILATLFDLPRVHVLTMPKPRSIARDEYRE
jgi:hypothetical protein